MDGCMHGWMDGYMDKGGVDNKWPGSRCLGGGQIAEHHLEAFRGRNEFRKVFALKLF